MMANAPPAWQAELSRRQLRAIVVGGSAGGMEAVSLLLAALPRPLGVPVLLVLHLGARTKADWSAVFAGSTAPVREAEDKEPAVPGTVYIAPPDYHLLVDGEGRLSLSVDERVNLSRPSIDVLFESAAWSYGEGLLGIVLSGANADGASGLSTIARNGGLCWVQAPDTTPFHAMPRAALRAVPGAQVMSVGEMAQAFATAKL